MVQGGAPRPQSVNSGATDWLVTHSGLQGHWDECLGDPGAGTMSRAYQAQAWGGQVVPPSVGHVVDVLLLQNLVRQERISERWYRNGAR